MKCLRNMKAGRAAIGAAVAAALVVIASSASAAEEKKGVRRVPIEKQRVDPPREPKTAPPAKKDDLSLPPSVIKDPEPPRGGSTDTVKTPPQAPVDRGCRGSPNCSETFDGGKPR
jgi:hypothetical protein